VISYTAFSAISQGNDSVIEKQLRSTLTPMKEKQKENFLFLAKECWWGVANKRTNDAVA